MCGWSARPRLFGQLLVLWLLPALALAAGSEPDAVWGDGPHRLAIATGSPGETGLLERLATEFARQNDAQVAWYRAGSGKALELLKQGKVDMILAHAPAAEEKAVAEGWATGRALVGSNEFWIVGPGNDPAQVAKAASAADALQRIAKSEAPFVSRGDNSGTHQRELVLWSAAGITPSGAWYRVTHDFMTASLKRADAERAYFLTDSSTFIVEGPSLPHLKRLYRGDGALANPYHVLYPVQATPGSAIARRFGDFLLSARGQELMGKYGRGKHGEPLYRNAAATSD
jgi:tungstate transport system substrate-binding protein